MILISYLFYLDGIKLPVTPSKLELNIRNQNKTISLINFGEVNILKYPGLTDISFELMIPNGNQYAFADRASPADHYLTQFEVWKTSRKPIVFLCSRMSMSNQLLFDTNMTVSLEDYVITENATNGLDLTIAVKLKQYRDYSTKKISVNANTNQAQITQKRETINAPQVKTYTVTSGDCLYNIAKKFLGDGDRWRDIWSLNKDKIVNPNLIYPNQILTMLS